MSRALVTFGIGRAAEQLAVSEPTFREYAERHAYRLLIGEGIPNTRPPSWFKVLVIRQALEEHDEVLWLDADVLILNSDRDLADEVPADAWQAMVAHHTPDGEVPNHGVWFCRRAMLPALKTIWSFEQYLNHPWWEQAAGCRMLGYNPDERPMVRRQETVLFERTHWLGSEWNSHRDDEHPDPRFWHGSVRGPDVAALMRDKLAAVAA